MKLGFLTRYRVKNFDIGSDISDLPFLGGRDIRKSPISRKKTRYHLRRREQYQGIRLSCPEYTDIKQDIVPDDARHQDTRTSCCCRYIRADFSPARAAATPGPPAGRTGHCPGAPAGPAPWSSARLGSLYSGQRLSNTETQYRDSLLVVQRLSSKETL
jgi:hypothetical protein